MKIKDILKKINGMQTIESIQSALKIDRTKAIYIVYRLRKKGYVLTKQTSSNKRIYFISLENVLGGVSYLDVINKYSPIKISSSETYKIYGRDVTIEETIVYSIKTHRFRYILASLGLFKKINNWVELYRLAKKNNLIREIASLYNLVEVSFPRIKKMNKLFLRYGKPKESDEFNYIIPNFKSKDYSNIENRWKIYIPFSRKDLIEYKK